MLPNRKLPWPVIWPAVEEIARSEGCRLVAYRDIADIWTIGWGHTKGVKAGDAISQEEADKQLLDELHRVAEGVIALLTRDASTWQFGAMVSLAYNIGLRAFAQSSVLRAHNAGDFATAQRCFGLWNRATINGKRQEVAGLTARRAREAALYGTRTEVKVVRPEVA